MDGQSKQDLEFSYIIYAPAGGHKVFRIIKIFKATRVTETVKSPELERVNKDFLNGDMTKVQARKEIENIRDELYDKAGVKKTARVFSSENKKVMEKFWEAEYEFRLSNLEDPKSARYDLERAVDTVGAVSLRTGTRQELQKAIDKKLTGNKQRRVVSKLNEILKFLKRDVNLVMAKREFNQVKYLTEEEVSTMLLFLDDERIRLMHEVAFRTGCRAGELFALEPRTYNVKNNTIRVTHQVDRNKKKRQTKNNKERTTFVLPGSEAILKKWFSERDKVKMYQRLDVSRVTKRASAAAFPDDKSKWITFHDLRHSYAIHLLSKGVPLSQVAQCIGDNVTTAEMFYIGFELSPGSIELINKVIAS